MTTHPGHPAVQAVRRMGLHAARMEDFEHWTDAERGDATALRLGHTSGWLRMSADP